MSVDVSNHQSIERAPVLSDEAVASRIEDIEACLGITDPSLASLLAANHTLESLDIGNTDVTFAGFERPVLERLQDSMVSDCMDHPADVVRELSTILQRYYASRSSCTEQLNGTTETRFITRDLRDPDHTGIDLDFSILENLATGYRRTTVKVPVRDDRYRDHDSMPFYVVADTDGDFQVVQKLWRHGQFQYQPLSPDSDHYHDRLNNFFRFSFVATDTILNRDDGDRTAADLEAHKLLSSNDIRSRQNR